VSADPAFAAQLAELAAEVKKAAGVSASDHGVAAGRDVNVHAESGSVAAVSLYGGVTIGNPPPGAGRDRPPFTRSGRLTDLAVRTRG